MLNSCSLLRFWVVDVAEGVINSLYIDIPSLPVEIVMAKGGTDIGVSHLMHDQFF